MSRSVNKVVLLGNLGANPEVKYTPNGTAVASISLATSSSYKDKTSGEWKEATEWHRVILWQRSAEIAGEYLKKGSKVYIEGRLQTRKYEKDGSTHYTTEVVARELIMLDGGNNNERSRGETTKADRGESGAQNLGDGTGITDDDIPF